MAISVVVKSDPTSPIKGQFKCEFTENELFLVKAKERVTIPLGSPAQYEGDNRLTVMRPEGRLEMSVKKHGSYENRLAKDLAHFIKEGSGDFDEKNYKLPWYFLAMAALPLGIPILSGGGAIPIGLGIGMAFGCVAVAQKEEWSIAGRLAASFGMVAAGYFGLFGLSVIVLLLSGG